MALEVLNMGSTQSQAYRDEYTSFTSTLEGSAPTRNVEERAAELQEEFLQYYPEWRHGQANEHYQSLRRMDSLAVNRAIAFFNAWRPLSRHQPQILLLLASAFPEQADQKVIILGNYMEEAGMWKGHDPHPKLLDDLILKLGGTPAVVDRSERIMNEFHNGLWRLTSPARAAGLLAGVESPALEISAFFREVVSLSGFPHLIDKDDYLKIHVRVEPEHIVDTHEMALRYMAQGVRERDEVLDGFREVMKFWSAFWAAAFDDLLVQ
jgi:Iron-containing redox enzyme